VLCLAQTEKGQLKLWEWKAPDLLKRGYEFEEDPGVCEAMERIAELFLQHGLAPVEEAGGRGGVGSGGGFTAGKFHTEIDELE
jgi:hypothetical protein